ncbi:predicted protein [Naegleria gruberi]|uniref:Predicted protein n=1 Tax=Naegleria gruberi TaxID=5762 RepID=D2VDE6_NAEGR|nr:uncharacterized protein NAEGRDRAFT_48594 [Naegleria gruberi]EFC45219.1 predicted protein [Naegleria gruberi]|eukprot:XP_002677963.1 predicted protein [Naegleria gruberi strain NEG-M]
MSPNESNNVQPVHVLPDFEDSSPENNKLLLAEEQAKSEKKNSTFFTCFNYAGVIVMVIGTILVSIAVYIGYSYQNNKIVVQVKEFSDKLILLNNTFFAEKTVHFIPKIKEPIFSREFSRAIKTMQSCNIQKQLMWYFYGESGIGKTTMLQVVLQELNPQTYIYVNLESGNSWKDIGIKLKLISVQEEATDFVIFHTLRDYLEIMKEQCPIIVIDGANRNPEITNKFIAFWRDVSCSGRPFGLLMLSSDGVAAQSISLGGGRVTLNELSPSNEFAREFLKAEFGIEDSALVLEIINITGNNIIYMQKVERMSDGQVDLLGLEKLVRKDIHFHLDELQKKERAYKYFKKLVKVLLFEPEKSEVILATIPAKQAQIIFSSNLLRKGEYDYTFQNSAVERFFRKDHSKLKLET